MFKKILVPVDGSQGGDKAIEYAAAIAKQFQAKVYTLFAIKPNEILVGYEQEMARGVQERYTADEMYDVGNAIVQKARDQLLKEGAQQVEGEVRDGHPAEVILDYVKEKGIDLIVIGSHGRRGLRALLGSVASEVVHQAPVPVMTVRMAAPRKRD